MENKKERNIKITKENITIERYLNYIPIIGILILFYILVLFFNNFVKMEDNVLNEAISYFLNKSYFLQNYLIDLLIHDSYVSDINNPYYNYNLKFVIGYSLIITLSILAFIVSVANDKYFLSLISLYFIVPFLAIVFIVIYAVNYTYLYIKNGLFKEVIG